MFNWPDTLVGMVAFAAVTVSAQAQFPPIGREATKAEVAAWDIDVRPDFKGLPKGFGTVAQGQNVWESKCASCHGVFGEAVEVFTPLVGGTTKKDVVSGNVASLKRPDYPGRTTFMKAATVSTLWDYINRAMPWTAPKSLTTTEVYAVTAYLLNMADIVDDKYTLSDVTIRDVQQRMPNRNGMTTAHAMWPNKALGGHAKPDTRNTLCMKNCVEKVMVNSSLPDFARNSHGNLAEQNRMIGAQRGVDTTAPESATKVPVVNVHNAYNASSTALVPSSSAAGGLVSEVKPLLSKYACTACHAANSKVVGPSFADISQRYEGKTDYLAAKIKNGGSGVWGAVPMPSVAMPDSDANLLAQWLATGAKP